MPTHWQLTGNAGPGRRSSVLRIALNKHLFETIKDQSRNVSILFLHPRASCLRCFLNLKSFFSLSVNTARSSNRRYLPFEHDGAAGSSFAPIVILFILPISAGTAFCY
ncbi:YjcZ family sporulation protein [Sporolactobacillus sp. KGMB 08714]|uniref:YjcZ family sporulation protein n=1 Tax=Sporolactobacillus sp. KGMB 08714 TaxID=3064704 RepID=UPI003FA76405